MLEVSAIGCRDGRVGGAGDGGDLTVGLQNRSAQGPVRGGNLPIGPCRGAVEGQYASGKVLADNGVDLRGKLVTAPALSRDGHPRCRQGSRSGSRSRIERSMRRSSTTTRVRAFPVFSEL